MAFRRLTQRRRKYGNTKATAPIARNTPARSIFISKHLGKSILKREQDDEWYYDRSKPKVDEERLPTIHALGLVSVDTFTCVELGVVAVLGVGNPLAAKGNDRQPRNDEPLCGYEGTVRPVVTFAVHHRADSVNDEAHCCTVVEYYQGGDGK